MQIESYLFDICNLNVVECYDYTHGSTAALATNDLCERFWSRVDSQEIGWLLDNAMPFTIAVDEPVGDIGRLSRYFLTSVKLSFRIISKEQATLFKLFCR